MGGLFGRIRVRHQDEIDPVPTEIFGVLQGRCRDRHLTAVSLLFESLEQGPVEYPVTQDPIDFRIVRRALT